VLTYVIVYSDFLETTNNPIPIPDRTNGIIQENDWAPARIRLVDSIGIILPPTGTCTSDTIAINHESNDSMPLSLNHFQIWKFLISLNHFELLFVKK